MKKKILFINGHLNIGGVEKSLLDILTHLDYERYEVDLLLLEKLGDYSNQLPHQVNVLLCSIEGTYGSLPKVILRCLKEHDWFTLKMRLVFLTMKLLGQKWIALAENMLTGGKNYDCVIGFRPGLSTQIAAFAVNAEQRITWWHHGEINVDYKTYFEAARHCDKVAVVSDACRQMLAEAFPQLTERLATVHNMLDVQGVQQKAEAFDPYPEKDVLHIVSVGRLAPEKHFENTILAAQKLMEQRLTFRWHLVGDGVLREELQQKAKTAGVEDRLIFEGSQVNPYPYMKHADLFVHPSYVESFGIVVTEALALGIPCVVTKSAGVMDFLKDGKNAILTEQSPDDLAEKIIMVLRTHRLQAQLKTNARCPEQFLPSEVMKKIATLLDMIA